MPPPANTFFKLKYGFKDADSPFSTSWSETFYIAAASADAALSVGILPANLNLRRAMLANSYTMQSVFAGDVSRLRNSREAAIPLGQGRGLIGDFDTGVDISEEPWDGVLVRLETGGDTNVTRSVSMRGIPTGVIVDNYRYLGGPIWATAFSDWSANFISSGHPSPVPYLMRTLIQPTAVNATGIAINDDKKSITITSFAAVNPSIIKGSRVAVTGSFGVHFVNKIWRVKRVDGLQIITYPGQKLLFGTVTGPVQYQLMDWTYRPIGVATPIRGCERKTGKPASPLRGRSRGRAI